MDRAKCGHGGLPPIPACATVSALVIGPTTLRQGRLSAYALRDYRALHWG